MIGEPSNECSPITQRTDTRGCIDAAHQLGSNECSPITQRTDCAVETSVGIVVREEHWHARVPSSATTSARPHLG